jgi:Short C-terminal domain/Phospholipase_D-nuclease N-terminal
MIAYDFPLLAMFWTLMFWFIWISWILLLFRVFADIFRSRDMGGGKKALWIVLVLALPFLGVLLYVIARGNSMSQRDLAQAEANEAAFRASVQQAAGSGSAADELTKLANLQSQGLITEAEFAAQKAKLLA